MLHSILTLIPKYPILGLQTLIMAKSVVATSKDTIFTVRHLINKLKEFGPDLPIKLINWNNDPTLESRDIGEIFFFERLDTQDGNKNNHVVISHKKYGPGSTKTGKLQAKSNKDQGDLFES